MESKINKVGLRTDLKSATYNRLYGVAVELVMYTGLRVDKEALSLKWDGYRPREETSHCS